MADNDIGIRQAEPLRTVKDGGPRHGTALAWRAIVLWLSLMFGGMPIATLRANSTESPLPLLTNVWQIRALTRSEAAKRYPVRVRGVVTYYNQADLLFIQDATGGIYVWPANANDAAVVRVDVRRGEVAEVSGVTQSGAGAVAMIASPELKVMGTNSMPAAKRIADGEPLSEQNDGTWIETEGIVRSSTAAADQLVLILVEGVREAKALVWIGHAKPPTLVDAKVRLQGVCAMSHDERGQPTGMTVLVPDLSHLWVTEPSQPTDRLDLQPIEKLTGNSLPLASGHRVRVRGTMILQRDKRTFFLEDPTGGVHVQLTQENEFQPGDQIEVIGFPSIVQGTRTIQEATATLLAHGKLPPAAAVTFAQIQTGQCNSRRVRLQGRTVRTEGESGEPELVLQTGQFFFSVMRAHPRYASGLGRFKPGSLVEVTGVCEALNDGSGDRTYRVLAGPSDIRVLAKPSWWTGRHVLWMAGTVGCVLLGLLGWVAQLRYQVRRRTRELHEEIEERKRSEARLEAEIAERMQIEKSLRRSEERFSKAFRASPIPLAIQMLREQTFVDTNEGFQELTGYSRAELIGRTPDELALWVEEDCGRRIFTTLREQMFVRNMGVGLRSKSGKSCEVLLSVELFELDGQPFILSIAQDISEQVRLENQLRQAQKMEAVGQLAAGVAHDFNNILTVVQGYTGLLLEQKAAECPERKPLQTIAAAADRATRLVRQLLTFSRKQFMQKRPIKLGETLATFADMLRRLVGERVEVVMECPARLSPIHADVGMIEQLVMNLAVNARDAMPAGGTLSIRAAEVELKHAAVRQNPEARLGRFICLTVTDTGCGISPEVLPRIFEPFFTTKGVGKGTGLGLATVYGIVKQHEGWIEVESTSGQGCTFRIFLPVAETKDEVQASPQVRSPLTGGKERILVAEDEEGVRDFVVEILRSQGYTVFAAASGPAALEIWEQRQGDVDLLFTDLVMPGGISGRELAERLTRRKPSLKVIYTSGYSPGMAGGELALFAANNFLPKPHGPGRLLQMVRTNLDAKREDGKRLAGLAA